jgi:hypothetical protein
MQTFGSRADRWSLAFIIPALAAIVACGDEPVAPKSTAPSKANAGIKGVVPVEVLVTNTSGGTDVGSLRWAADQLTQPGGVIKFDAALAGKTITLDAGLQLRNMVEIIAPTGGVTISGKDQFRIITSAGQVSLTNVSITKGYADYGAAVAAGTLELHHSTVYGNRSPVSAIYASNLALHQSTVSGNNVGRAAVEYSSDSYTVAIQNSTIAFNAPGAGLGPNGRPATDQAVHLINAIVSNNGSPQQNCTSSFGFYYWGDNISNDWTCGEVGIRVADPKLFPLANNGGPSMTHAISHLGAAFNSATSWQWCLDVDQRYVPRDAKCDVGAFEFNDWTKVTITIDPNVKVDAATGRALMTGTVTCSRDETFKLALELHQEQKVGKQVIDVHAAAAPTVSCSTTPTTWAQKMILTDGAWVNGPAQASAQTYQTPEWVTPASAAAAVKVVISRK